LKFVCKVFNSEINIFKSFPCLAEMKHMNFSADYNPSKHSRIISFYCLTHKNEFVLQNKPTIDAKEVDKAVHPSWATSAGSKASKWACPCFYKMLKMEIQLNRSIYRRNRW